MDREYTPGDAVVVNIGSLEDSRNIGHAKRDGFSFIIKEPVRDIGERTSVEILEIDFEAQSVVAVPANRPGLDDQYQHDEVLTVSVDEVRNGSAFVEISPGRTLKVKDYPHHDQNIDVKVRSVESDFMRCVRFFRIDGLSMASLLETDHNYPCSLEFADDLTPDELNVFISHFLASGNWSLLRKILEQFSDVDLVELNTTTKLLRQRNDISSRTWRDILYTVVQKVEQLTASVGADYLGAVLAQDEIPKAWRESVLANTEVLLDTQDVGMKYSEIDIPPESSRNATVSDQALDIRYFPTDQRHHLPLPDLVH